ncbi:GGDEF domain-containing protein [Treponema sp.]|uniref:GGDEF domain-containing protein n=1 Tax=Treponema sp. TaxID=166 RepID=UPI00388DF9CD
MKNLEIKIAYIDKDFKILDRNKEFYSYFEMPGFLYDNISDLLAPEHKQQFLEFLEESRNRDEFRAYKFKKISGQYQYNIVSVGEDVHNEKKCISVYIIEVTDALVFYREANSFEKRINHALGITNEYLFYYQKSTNIFRMHNFLQNQKITIYEQNIDSWAEQVIKESLIDEESISLFMQKIQELKECNSEFEANISCSFRSGALSHEKMTFKAIRLEDNGDVFMVGRMLPELLVEQSDKSTELLQELKIDPLTDVYNKKAIMSFAEKRFTPGTKEHAVLAIVDLDHFKPVNDAYGHLAGDKVLKKAGEVLKEVVGEQGVIGRYGGDEFLVILEDMSEESIFRSILRAINVNISAAFENTFSDIKVTASVGASQYSKDGDTFDELFKKADFCLYRAKDKGRDRYVFYREDLHGELYKKATESKTEGIKYDVREVLELKSMSDFLLNLRTEPHKAINTVLEHMVKTYNLGAVNVYYGPAMKRIYCVGEASKKLEDACYVFSQEFSDAFNKKPFIRINFTTELRDAAKSFAKILENRGVKSSIQCILGTVEKPLGIITFDRLKEGAMWAEYEVNCCVMVAAALNLLTEKELKELFE